MPILVPLNTFKTLANTVTTSDALAYQTPTGVSTVVLLAQFVNAGSVAGEVSANLYRSGANTELIKQMRISANDASTFLTGRLVLEEGNRLFIRANNANFKFVFSYLETANA
jgi:hypothetical protein